MDYAVIQTSGRQYKVKPGDLIKVDKLDADKNKEVFFDQVALWVTDGKVRVGTPNLVGVKVWAKVLDQIKGEKIKVRKFRAKSRYRRTIGFRSLLTTVKIEKIEEASPSKKK